MLERLATPTDTDDSPRGRRVHRTLPSVERDAEAARLRAAGLSYRQVGQRLGVTHTTVVKMEQRALERVVLPSVQELRRAETSKLDADESALRAIIESPPMIVASNGTVTAVPNVDAVSRAIDVRTRLAARRARLLGLDAPVLTVHRSATDSELNDIMRGLLAQIANRRYDVLEGKVEG